MGDHRAGTSGPTVTSQTPSTPPAGRRIARHAAEQPPATPYVGRRVARVTTTIPAPVPVEPIVEPIAPPAPTAYVGRRIAARDALPVEPGAVETLTVEPVLAGAGAPAHTSDDLDDLVGHLLAPTAVPTIEPYVGRRIARTVPLLVEPEPECVSTGELSPATVLPASVLEIVPTIELTPTVAEPVTVTVDKAPEPDAALEVEVADESPTSDRQPGRRAASRRTRLPSMPLLAGVAVLAISAGGALQATSGVASADAAGRIAPAGALSGTDGIGTRTLLGSRGTVVSRGGDRTATSLRAAADAQARQRDAALSAYAQQAQKKAAQIELHQWVLPVAPGLYHLTARFGDYSSLWSTFHTGLDFAGPTGTPIMAVAGGVITETGYSGAYGNRTIEQLPDGTELWYCHQNAFGTSVGATVKPGQVIGYIGSTGNVTGPHLHLEVHPGGGDPVDPYTALVDHGLQP